ncbi:MAG: DUF4097 family beta strand repeat-containing protein [Bacteroidota bacterium]
MKQVVIILAFLGGLSGSLLQAQSTDLTSFDGVTDLVFEGQIGDIVVHPAPAERVMIKFMAGEEAARVPAKQEGGRLIIKEVVNDAITSQEGGAKVTSYPTSYQWDMYVPKGVSVQLTTATGSIRVLGGQGKMEATTATGAISVKDYQGKIFAKSSTGALSLDQVEGQCSISGGTGSIALAGGSGSWEVESGTGHIEAEALRLTGASSFRSGTGNVNLNVVNPGAENMDIHSGTGLAMLSLEGQKLTGTLVMGYAESKERGKVYKGKIRSPFQLEPAGEEKIAVGRNTQTNFLEQIELDGSKTQTKITTGLGKAQLKS